MHYNCLIIDDEKELAEATSEYLNLFDVKTCNVSTANECLDFFKDNDADLILLDINLKEDSGFTLCKKLREIIHVPILFISARQSDDDVIVALSIGGDDYIKKPYNLNVLLAKVKVILNRYGSSVNSSNKEKLIFENKGLKVDLQSGKVFVNNDEVKFKAMEYKLLIYLINNRNRIINKEELFKNVWEDIITADGTLNVHVRHIREKIENDANNPKRLKTVWGRGYIFEEI